jgi:hypothetical protein
MGFIDKVKATVKTGAEQAAAKAQEEYEKMQRRRELAQAYEDLGGKTFELVERGDLSHSDLAPLVDRIRTLNADLAAADSEESAEAAPAETAPAQPAEHGEPPAEEAPPGT